LTFRVTRNKIIDCVEACFLIMKIHVSRIPEEGLRIDGEEMEDVLIRGEMETALRLLCGRCLAEFEKKIEIPVNLTFFPAQEETASESRELSEEEVGSSVYGEDEIDLGVFMKELVELHKPMKPLCSEECKGICPECGANRNEKECGCAVRHVDPRFQALETMANPTSRHSRSRRDKRRSQWKGEKPNSMACPECGEPKLPHRVCTSCGTYKSRTVLEVVEKET
jgi:uncharacterized protein